MAEEFQRNRLYEYRQNANLVLEAEKDQKLDLRAVDAGDFTKLSSAVRAIEDQLGPIEVLIYNAFSATPAPPSQIPLEALVGDFRVNVGGALAAVQAVLPAMQARERGTILLTGGGLALDRIAQVLGMQPNTVSKTLQRVREQLRACIEERMAAQAGRSRP